ncbi:MAG: hypothetical protein WD939_09320 [Dehalococcoidia bacterium]
MPAPSRLGLACALLVAVALAVACGGGSTSPPATPTPRPLPEPVTFAGQPAGNFVLGDPSFEALPGATAHFGTLGGAIYQIEMPDDWNGRLVLYLHGSSIFDTELTIDMPAIRHYLIRNGYAWGASSFSSNVPDVWWLAADESAALWDHFVSEFRRPERTYVTGHSMGGFGSVLSAQRYPDRYDGSLPLCGTINADSFGDYFVAGAFASGVTQAEFDAVTAGELLNSRILPALDDPSAYDQFANIFIDLSGGPRPFDGEGIAVDADMWSAAVLTIDARVYDNVDVDYQLGPASEVADDAFNRDVVRVEGGPRMDENIALGEITGDVQVPTLAISNTGDVRVPVSAARQLQRLADAEGRSDLLVQRFVQAPEHCGFTNSEWEQALEDLVAWVEDGQRPEGEDVLVEDASNFGERFTLAPRFGSAAADAVPGAGERLTISGTMTLDGQPIDGFLSGVSVRKDGLARLCNFISLPIKDGAYSVTVASDSEVPGCGQEGAQLLVSVFTGDQGHSPPELVDWPAGETELSLDIDYSSTVTGAGRPATVFYGDALDGNGEHLPAGTMIEAYIGDTLCGISSPPPVLMNAAGPDTYHLFVVTPASVPACAEGGDVTFRVDGQLVPQTAVADLGVHEVTLQLP